MAPRQNGSCSFITMLVQLQVLSSGRQHYSERLKG